MRLAGVQQRFIVVRAGNIGRDVTSSCVLFKCLLSGSDPARTRWFKKNGKGSGTQRQRQEGFPKSRAEPNFKSQKKKLLSALHCTSAQTLPIIWVCDLRWHNSEHRGNWEETIQLELALTKCFIVLYLISWKATDWSSTPLKTSDRNYEWKFFIHVAAPQNHGIKSFIKKSFLHSQSTS